MLVKQKTVTPHHCDFKTISLTLLLRSLFLVKFINVGIVTQNWNNIGSNVYVSTAALITSWIRKKSALSISMHFHKNSLIVTCCTFGRFEIWILTPNRFKNQTNDTLKLPGHNYNHQGGFLKQKIVTLHCCGLNLNSLNTVTLNTILDKNYQWNSSY